MSDTPSEQADESADVVVPFPVSEEERNRRVMIAATQLAGGVAGSWKLWYERRAGELGIDPNVFAELIQAQIADREQKERRAQAEARLTEDRAKRLRLIERDRQREQQRIEHAAAKKVAEKAKALADIIKLPRDQHEDKIAELAQKLDLDVGSLSAEFAELVEAESEWDIEPWDEPVTTAVVLEELIARIDKHIKTKQPYEALAIALWVLMAWVHEEAAHYSVYLFATSPKEDCGKTTLIIEVVGRLVPKPYVSGSDPTISSIFRTADRDKPTMLFDNVDTLFQRKPEITGLFLNGWTRGVKIPRVKRIKHEWQTVWYDPFCPKACSLIGTDLPRPLLGRCLLIELWPLKPGEEVAEVKPFDIDLLDAFKTLRRKLLRWSADNASQLKNAEPLFPAGFTTRPRSNAKLLLAIAELASDPWAEQARTALDKLMREKRKPSWLDLLLGEFWNIFVDEKRKDITSEQLIARLTTDPTSEWCEYGRGHNVTQREVAALLRGLVRPHPVVSKTRVRGYHCADFLEKQIFEHFLGRDPLFRSGPPDTPPKKSRPRKKSRHRNPHKGERKSGSPRGKSMGAKKNKIASRRPA